MTTHFITAEVDLTDNPADLPAAVEAALGRQGYPLRWAVTGVDEAAQVAQVEGVVTQDDLDLATAAPDSLVADQAEVAPIIFQ